MFHMKEYEEVECAHQCFSFRVISLALHRSLPHIAHRHSSSALINVKCKIPFLFAFHINIFLCARVRSPTIPYRSHNLMRLHIVDHKYTHIYNFTQRKQYASMLVLGLNLRRSVVRVNNLYFFFLTSAPEQKKFFYYSKISSSSAISCAQSFWFSSVYLSVPLHLLAATIELAFHFTLALRPISVELILYMLYYIVVIIICYALFTVFNISHLVPLLCWRTFISFPFINFGIYLSSERRKI